MYILHVLIRCLGVVGVSHQDGATSLAPAQRRILAILVAAGPTGLSSEAIAEEIYFDEILPAKWNDAFRTAMSRLRRSVDVITANGHYRIDESSQEVDVWELRSSHEIQVENLPEVQLQQLLSGDPFPGVDVSPRISYAVEEVASLRIAVIQRMLISTKTNWSASTLQAIRTLTAREYFRDQLLAAAVQLHVEAGYRDDARRLVKDAGDYVENELGAILDPAIRSLVPVRPDETAQVSANQTIDGRVVGIADWGDALGALVRTELATAVQRAVLSGGALLEGESGAGKTALLHSLAGQWAAEGSHVLWLTGRQAASAAYGPFLALMPAMEEDLAPLFEPDHDIASRSKCWSAARRRLTTEFAGLPLIVVIDDAQWLDSHSQQLVDFLVASTGATPIRCVVAGRTGDSTHWAIFADGLSRAGLHRIDIGEFSIEELVDLIGIHHCDATSKQRRDFAAALIARKAALPLVAHELVQTAAPDTLALTEPRPQSRRPQIWTSRVGPATLRVAAVAAVLGTTFRVADLAVLSGWDIDAVVHATDELQDAGIVVTEQRPDEFSFRHVLTHQEFDAVLNRGERRRLHFDAASLATGVSAVHRRAIHVREAGALMDNHEVVEAVLASARAFHGQGSYREAVSTFSQARSISDDEISARDLLTFASAIASSGGDDWEIRSRAFERSRDDKSEALRLEIALAGVPHTEDTMGDERRVTMLQQVDPLHLTDGQRVSHAAALSRELGLLGFHHRALETCRQAVAVATSAEDRVKAWLGGWAACRSIPPAEWPTLPPDRDDVTDPELVSRLAQIEFAQAVVTGDDMIARSRLRLFRSHPYTQSDPLRRWHAAVATAMYSFVDGDWGAHEAYADEALTVASRHGVVAAFSTRAAQEFVRRWVAGRHVEVLAALEAAPPDLRVPFLARAAVAVSMAEAPGRAEEATELIRQVAARAAARRSPFSHPAAGILASAPSELLSNTVRHQLRSVLEPFAGTALVIGAAVSHAGPVSWSLANLVTEADQREVLLRQACNEADRWNLKLWAVRCRVDLAAATGSSSVLEEAKHRAQGTDLISLLPD